MYKTNIKRIEKQTNIKPIERVKEYKKQLVKLSEDKKEKGRKEGKFGKNRKHKIRWQISKFI